MQKLARSVAVLAAVSCAHSSLTSAAPAAPAPAPAAAKPGDDKPADVKPGDAKPDELKPEEKTSRGTVTIGGRRLEYTAVAGTLVVHPKDAEENPAEMPGDKGDRGDKSDKGERTPPAAAMSYVAYFATGQDSGRPVM